MNTEDAFHQSQIQGNNSPGNYGENVETKAKLSYDKRKKHARRIRKFDKTVADAEETITEMDSRISELETRMITPEGAADTTLYTEHDKLKGELSGIMDKWEEATETLEKEKSEIN